MFTVLQVLNGFEIVENLGQSKNVKGNLKKILEFWFFFRCFILRIKRNPIWLSFAFLGCTTCVLFEEQRFCPKNVEFAENSITELLESERIKQQVSCKSVVVNPFSVSVQPNGKKRLILDLRYVNHFIKRLKFKYDDWKIASLMFHKNGYMFSFDLKRVVIIMSRSSNHIKHS